MTTQTLLQLFSGIAVIGVIMTLISDDSDDNQPPDDGLKSPIYEGT
jgi:hypothetical protein